MYWIDALIDISTIDSVEARKSETFSLFVASLHVYLRRAQKISVAHVARIHNGTGKMLKVGE